MFDPEFMKLLSGAGVAGILAAFCILILNRTWKEHNEQRILDAKSYSDKLLGLHELEKGRADKILDVVISNTAQTSINTEVLRGLNSRLNKDAFERAQEQKV